MWAMARPTVLKNVAPSVAHVGEERRRREPAPQRERRAAGEARGTTVDVERVAVEQRHRAVQDVVGRRTASARAVRAADPGVQPHRLRCAGRARREDQQEQVVGGGERRRATARAGERRRAPCRRPSAPTTCDRSAPTQVEVVEQAGRRGVGDDQLAVGVADVGGQLGAPPGRVDADHRRPGERRARRAGTGTRGCSPSSTPTWNGRVGSRAASSHAARADASASTSRPGPRPTLEQEADAVVVGPQAHELGRGRRWIRLRF